MWVRDRARKHVGAPKCVRRCFLIPQQTCTTLEDIAKKIHKPDGSKFTQQGARYCIQLCDDNGGLKWDGDVAKMSLGGRPRDTTGAMDRALTKRVLKHRGSAIVTVAFLQTMLPEWRGVSDTTIGRRLFDAGLAWLRRRRKPLVPAKHKVTRLWWARWVKTRPDGELKRWAYTDGTTFYLARTDDDATSKSRAALGPFGRRQADGGDALYEDCVGPSALWKAQGLPVRTWGLLANGVLHITVLPEGECMNRRRIFIKEFPGDLSNV